MSRTAWCVAGVAAVGVGYRLWLAAAQWPMCGDPVFSYCYRALLIANGDFRAVELMWHPPGYPLLLGGLTALGFGRIDPYTWGVLVSLASYVGLAVVVDRLIAPRAGSPLPRLVAAAFLACYETLALWAAGPLTEPVYLFLLYATVLAVDRSSVGAPRALAAGVFLGLACTVRLEGAAPTVGVGLFLLVRHGPRAAVGFSLGWLLSAGWLAADPDYLRYCRSAQESAYTFPAAHGPGANLRRLVECAYHAVTVWLPFVLLLPYWLILAVGLLRPTRAAGRESLTALLLCIVLPSLLAVGGTIMHKRTGSFLLPAAAVWVAFGSEVIADRWNGSPRARWLVGLMLLGLIGADLGRTAFRLRRAPNTHDPVTGVAAGILREAAAEPGTVWAFSGEPEVYTLWGRPIYYPFRSREQDYTRAYLDHVGRPESFVRALRGRGFRYLAFALRDEPAGGSAQEPQPYDGFIGESPLRSDLLRVRDESLGLSLLGSAPAEGGTTRVYVFQLTPP